MSETKDLKNSGKSAKEFLKEHGAKGTVIRYSDRITLEIIVKNHKHYRLAQIIRPHKLWAEKLIADKIAKKVK